MRIRSVNPNDGSEIAQFEETSEQAANEAVERARVAQKSWAKETVATRIELMRTLAQMMSSRGPEILEIMKIETGRLKPDAEAEVFDVVDAVEYYIGKLNDLPVSVQLGLDPSVADDTTVEVGYAPYGVIALIMPWNFPFYVPMMSLIPSLLSGNAVVFKPSEYATMVGLKIGELVRDAGFPADLVQVLPGGEAAGQALVKAGPDKIFFTGSVDGGMDIVTNAGTTPVQAELGGNSAALVLEDADISLAAAGIAWAGTYHSGQDCAGIKRVFAHQDIADRLIVRLTEILSELRPGVDYGPYISRDARDVVKARIDAAVAAGSRLVVGGEVDDNSKGNWLSPSLVIVDDPTLELVAKETFGNTIPVQVVESVDEAIDLANDTVFGLSNAVFSADLESARRLAGRLESGMVFINDPFINLPGQDHWTGWKQSGIGSMESKLEQCVRKKVVGVNLGGEARDFWYPYEAD